MTYKSKITTFHEVSNMFSTSRVMLQKNHEPENLHFELKQTLSSTLSNLVF